MKWFQVFVAFFNEDLLRGRSSLKNTAQESSIAEYFGYVRRWTDDFNEVVPGFSLSLGGVTDSGEKCCINATNGKGNLWD